MRFASIVRCALFLRKYAPRPPLLELLSEGENIKKSPETKLIIIPYKPRCSNCWRTFSILNLGSFTSAVEPCRKEQT